MRTLAEEAGGLLAVGGRALPTSVVTGGIRRILQRRIERVSPHLRETLRLMAVAGRRLDLNLLKRFEPRPDSWLAACADAAVLEVSDQQWRFTHDKLREALVFDLEVELRRQLHRQVAMALEEAYADASTQASALAYHYREAGMEMESAHFTILAAEQALAQGALREAASLLRQVLPIIDRRHPNASPLEWARAHRLLAQALFGLHDANECVRISEKALARLRPARWGKTTPLDQNLSLLGLVGEHVLHQALSSSVRLETDSVRRSLLHEQLLMILASGEMYAYLGQPLLLLRAILDGLEIARTLDDVPLQAYTTSVVAYILEFTPLRGLAQKYLRQAQGLVGRTVNPLAEAQVLRIGGIVYMNNGQLERSTTMLDRAAALFRMLGDDFMLLFSLNLAAVARMLMGLPQEADSLFAEIDRIARRGRHQHALLSQKAWLGLFRARQGRHGAVRKDLIEAYGQSEHHTDPLVAIALTTGIITASLRTEDFADVRRFAAESLALMPQNPTGINYWIALAAVLDAYLTIWERAASPLAAADQAALERSLSLLKPYPSAMLLARPQANLFESRVAVLRNEPALAWRKATAALSFAMQMQMPYDEALAHEQLGRLLSIYGPNLARSQLPNARRAELASEHLRRAVLLLRRFGDDWRADRVERTLR